MDVRELRRQHASPRLCPLAHREIGSPSASPIAMALEVAVRLSPLLKQASPLPKQGSPRRFMGRKRLPKHVIPAAAYAARSEMTPVNAISRKPWTPEEDDLLRQLVKVYGKRAWRQLAPHLSGRTSKQCRERWQNHLDSGINREVWSVAEERRLVELQRHLGNSWSKIAKYMNGRTDSAIKNQWNTVLRRGTRISHLLVGGTLPSSFPGGVVPPSPPRLPAAITESGDDAEAEEEVLEPPPIQAIPVFNLVRSSPDSSLAQLIDARNRSAADDESGATANKAIVFGAPRSEAGRHGLDALVGMVAAQNRAQLLEATSQLKAAVVGAVVDGALTAGSGPDSSWSILPDAESILSEDSRATTGGDSQSDSAVL